MSNNIYGGQVKVGWIAGMPRSGTTWLSQIFASSPDVRLKFCPLFSYEFKNLLDEDSSSEDWEKLFFDVYRTHSEYLDQEYLRKQGLVPTFSDKKENPCNLFIKSTRFHNLIPHILKLNIGIRFVHLVRNPCATIHSWLTNPNEFPSHANPVEEWRHGECRKTGPGEYWGFNDWVDVTSQALQLEAIYPDQFKILRYENLVENTHNCVEEMFRYFGIPLLEQTENFIKLSHRVHDANKRSVFKDPKQCDSWKTELDPLIVSECMRELKNTDLEQFLVD